MPQLILFQKKKKTFNIVLILEKITKFFACGKYKDLFIYLKKAQSFQVSREGKRKLKTTIPVIRFVLCFLLD